VLSNLTFPMIKRMGLEKFISDLETAIVEAKDGILTLKDEIDALRLSVLRLLHQPAHLIMRTIINKCPEEECQCQELPEEGLMFCRPLTTKGSA